MRYDVHFSQLGSVGQSGKGAVSSGRSLIRDWDGENLGKLRCFGPLFLNIIRLPRFRFG
jgi:hypothetical protein